MADYKDSDGNVYSEADLRRYATAENLSFEDYLEEYSLSLDKLDYNDAGFVDKVLSIGAGLGKDIFSKLEGFADLKDAAMFAAMTDDNEMTAEAKEVAMEAMKKSQGWASDPFEEIIQALDEKTLEYDEASILETFQKGDATEAGFRTVEAGIASLPSILMAAVGPAGLAALAATTAGSKFEEEFEEDASRDATSLLINATGSGVIEAGFEFATRGLLKRAGLIAGLGGNANIKLAKEILKGGAGSIVKNIVGGVASEGVSEAATELTSAFWDQISLNKKIDWERKWYEIADAGIVGGLVGGVTAGIGEINKKSQKSKNLAFKILADDLTSDEVSKRQETLKQLITDQKGTRKKADPNDDDGEWELLEDAINNEAAAITELKERSLQGLSELNQEEFDKYFANVKRSRALKKIIKGKSIQAKNMAQNELDILREENLNTLREASDRKLEKNLKQAENRARQRGGEIKVWRTQEEYIEAVSGVSSKKVLNKDGKLDYSNEFKKAAREHRWTDGKIKNGVSHINLQTSQKLGSVSVGSHEVLHSIMDKYIRAEDGTVTDEGVELIDEMMSELSSKDRAVVQKRIDDHYRYNKDGTEKNKRDYYDEHLNVLHDAIVKKKIVFNKNFDAVGGRFNKVFKRFGYGSIDLSSGKGLFNLIRTYTRAIETGESTADLDKIIEDSKGFAITNEKENKKSVSLGSENDGIPLNEKIDPLTRGAKTKEQLQEGGMNSAFSEIYTGILDGSFDRLFGSVSQEQKEIQRANLADRFINYDPAKSPSLFAWMRGGRGKEGNIDYAAKVAKKELAKPKTKSLDITKKTKEGELRVDIEDAGQDPEQQLIAKEKAEKAKTKKSAEVKLREKLKLNSLKTKIEKSVRLAFGAKLPDIKLKNFKLALAKAFDLALFKVVKNSMGTRDAYVDWVKTYIPYLHGKKKLTPSQWIQLERNVPEGKKIFATRRRITNTEEVLDLQSKGLLPLSAKAEEGPWLITMLPTPSPTQIEAFFTGKNIKKVLGYTISNSAKGTRKDSIAKGVAINLGFDATMEVAQEPEVLKRWQGINELNNQANYENQIEILGKQIDRDPGYRHSKSLAKATGIIGKTKTKEGVDSNKIRANFYGKRDGWLVEIADEGAYTKDSMRKLMDETWTDNEIPAVMKSKIINDYISLLKPFTERVKSGPSNPDFKNIVEYVSQKELDEDMDREIGKALGLIKAVQKYFDDPNQLTQQIRFMKDLAIRRLNKIGDTIENREIILLEAIRYKDHLHNSYKAGKRGSIFGNTKSFIKNHLKSIDPNIKNYSYPTLTKKDKAKLGPYKKYIKLEYSDGTSKTIEIPKTPPQEISQEMVDGNMSKEEVAWRKSEAKKDWKYLNELMEDANNLINGENDYSVIEIAMLMKGLMGNMKTVLRSSADFEYSPVDPPTKKLTRTVKKWNAKKKKFEYVTEKTFEYEHGITARTISLLLISHHVYGNKIDLDLLQESYSIGAIHVDFNKNLSDAGLQAAQQLGYKIGDIAPARWYGFMTADGYSHPVKSNKTGVVHGKGHSANWESNRGNRNSNSLNKAEAYQLKYFKDGKTKGISAFDFDETLIDGGENEIIAIKGDERVKISSADWPLLGPQFAADGYQFDFSDFINVKGGVEGPLMQKFRNQIEKYGTDNVYILTARPSEAAPAIHAWLTQQGIDLPIKNITGLGNSTGAAKAEWMIDKLAEGYNDFYFVDDAMSNVEAVADLLNQFDVKSKVVQARNSNSLNLGSALDQIIEENEGINASRAIDPVEAEVLASKVRKGIGAKFFNTPGSNDFMGLIYTIANARGKKGEAQIAFFENNLYKPYKQGVQRINQLKQNILNGYNRLLKVNKGTAEMLKKVVPGTSFTYDTAIRVYIWSKKGIQAPGLGLSNINKLIDAVNQSPILKDFADGLDGLASVDGKGYVTPEADWLGGTILSDLDSITNNVGRKEHLQKFIHNRKEILGDWKNGKLTGPRMDKLKAAYGSDYVDALNDIIWAMENGNHRPSGQNAQVNKWLNWVSNSVGAIMFFNTRSALLQTLSTFNFVNWGDNNPIKAAKALADFPQFLKDFSKIFNSDFLKQRRGGLKLDVNEARLAKSVNEAGGNKVKAMLAHLLKIGFLPTQIADSFAIAAGGATFFRNRTNTYLKKGLSQKQAEAKAWEDMIDASEPVQQSSDPSLISAEQRSVLGMVVLAFQNVTMQYSRRMKKSIIDLAKGRGDVKTNISRIVYYGVVQNLVFNALQSALFSLAFDDEDEKRKLAKRDRVVNGMADSLLRGLGIPGAIVATSKNVILEYAKQNKKGWSGDQTYTLLQLLNISPPIGSKARKFYGSTQTEKFNKKIIPEMSLWDVSNPRYQSIGNAVEAITNIPMGRTINKINNIKQALDSDNAIWQRIAMMLGWNRWDVGVKDSDIVKIKDEVKTNKSNNEPWFPDPEF